MQLKSNVFLFVCSCVLFVHWSAEVSREGVVTPKINLLTKIPERGETVVLSSDSSPEPCSNSAGSPGSDPSAFLPESIVNDLTLVLVQSQ